MDLKFIVEAILFSAQKPLNLKEIRDVFAGAPDHAEGDEIVRGLKKVKEDDLAAALEELAKDHETAARSYRLVCVAGAWQFVTQPEFAPWLKALVGHKARPPRLSQPALETLAIIAYRQPLTRTDIEQIRGVAVDGVMQTLLERGLVEQRGRAEVVGRPMTYGTTALFLEYFGLPNLEALPAADELRRIPIQKPEDLATADAAQADAPAEPSNPSAQASAEASNSTEGQTAVAVETTAALQEISASTKPASETSTSSEEDEQSASESAAAEQAQENVETEEEVEDEEDEDEDEEYDEEDEEDDDDDDDEDDEDDEDDDDEDDEDDEEDDDDDDDEDDDDDDEDDDDDDDDEDDDDEDDDDDDAAADDGDDDKKGKKRN